MASRNPALVSWKWNQDTTSPSALANSNPALNPFGTCSLRISIGGGGGGNNSSTSPASIRAPVFMYYRLSNFYQNHRRYVKSFDSTQLLAARPIAAGTGGGVGGVAASSATYLGNCAPLDTPDSSSSSNKIAQYYPCGLIANSMFSGKKSLCVRERGGGGWHGSLR